MFEKVKSFFVKEAGKALVSRPKSSSSSLIEDDDNSKRVESMKIYKRSYERVPLVTAIIDVQADQTVQSFHFEGPNETKLSEFADKVNLTRFFHRIAKAMLLYGNAYVESVKKGEEIVELKILNPIWVDVWRTPTGDITGYSQIIEKKELVLWGTTGNKSMDKKFKKRITKIDDISHFKYNVLGSEKYGRSIVGPLLPNLQTKLDMESDLRKVLFKYVAPLIWAKVGNDQLPANEAAVSDIANTLRDLQAESEITTSHLVDLSVLDFNAKGMDIKTPLVHTEQQIITGGQTPPVLLGMSGGDEKSSEAQLRNFGQHILAIQREVKFEFEDQIIVKQGLGTPKDKLIWEVNEGRKFEQDVDILRGLVTDGVVTAQKANDLLPPRYKEILPPPVDPLLNQQDTGDNGLQKPRPNQKSNDKVKDNPNNPQKTTKNPKSLGKRINKSDKTEK